MDNKSNEESSEVVKKLLRHDEKPSSPVESSKLTEDTEKRVDEQVGHKTTYLETLIHHFKGNVGPGCYAMGDAFKNGGLVLAPILTVILGIVCVHAQHILLNCSEKMKIHFNLPEKPDYADTIELCFKCGPDRFKKWAKTCKSACNVFIVVTQLGFCCIYFLFIGTNVKQVLDYYGVHFQLNTLIIMSLIPILMTSLITNLKFLAPFSAIANVCMISGISITFYYSMIDVPSPTERQYVASLNQLPLFFGTAIFAFEGIALVLPLQNCMKKPSNFSKICGVLNVGMVLVTAVFVSIGFLGYLKFGDKVEGSLSLNLPIEDKLAQLVKVATAFGVMLGYPLQFFIAIQIMFPSILNTFKVATDNPLLSELLFRTFMVFVTFFVTILIPKLSLLLSLIGALFATALALVFPPVIQCILDHGEKQKSKCSYINIKNCMILLVALLGFTTGTYESLSAIIKDFQNDH